MGGAEQVLKMIAKYYMDLNFDIYIFFLTHKVGTLWDDLNGKVNLIYTTSDREVGGLYQLFKNVKEMENNYEYAYTSHMYLNSFIGLLSKLRLIKINHFVARESTSIFVRYSGLRLCVYKTLYRLGYSSVDLLICQTDFMKNQLIQSLPWMKTRIKIETIANPIDIDCSLFKEKVDIIIGTPYIVSAGRLISVKGFDILIKAFAQLDLKDYNLVILGEGQEREKIELLIDKLHLSDKVLLIGYQDNVYPFFKKANLCVVSSLIEGFPNVLLQMMSQNEKVVSTLCAGGIDQIQGIYTCEPNNESSLAEAMMNCLITDTTKNRELFDKELKERSLEKFIAKINFYLKQQ
jgi:glycosyltransferase involved in cell wall biosynthesis